MEQWQFFFFMKTLFDCFGKILIRIIHEYVEKEKLKKCQSQSP